MATLKISDLSVGDWVNLRLWKCDYDDPETLDAKVLSIEGNSVGVGYDNSGIVMSAFVEDLQPIPITAEALEKNGFMRCSVEFNIYEYSTLLGKMLRTTQVHLNAPQHISVFVHDTTIERGYYHREKISVSIRKDKAYIHDLQHALRLAGLDKEINL